ncbi:uncharacterized protein TM35_000191850 [Trypanosoma theileri]|uniref:Uncharacterized protein n=1 Tax=Trypanosoma theileri TaxID=67003 RepID=A0A1X0NTK6_9TRYP|nr:uncharacterized protein TM35_000191850 [Trypanosoma theileri]ORC87941.1 hypothetical protein TM35_000191850 [Trypanosoma theileri]
MSKAPSQNATKKWVSQRALARSEDSSNRKTNVATQPPPPAAPEHPTPPPAPTAAQLPQSLVFERQDAVDILSNLYHNTESVQTIETGPSIYEPRDASKFHEELMECLKTAGYV